MGKNYWASRFRYCFVTFKSHIYYCNNFLRVFEILYHGVWQISIPKWNSQNSPLSQVKFIIRKREWHVSVTAVLNFPLEVWRRILHRASAVKNKRQQFWIFSIILHFGSLAKNICTDRVFCWADMLFHYSFVLRIKRSWLVPTVIMLDRSTTNTDRQTDRHTHTHTHTRIFQMCNMIISILLKKGKINPMRVK